MTNLIAINRVLENLVAVANFIRKELHGVLSRTVFYQAFLKSFNQEKPNTKDNYKYVFEIHIYLSQRLTPATVYVLPFVTIINSLHALAIVKKSFIIDAMCAFYVSNLYCNIFSVLFYYIRWNIYLPLLFKFASTVACGIRGH